MTKDRIASTRRGRGSQRALLCAAVLALFAFVAPSAMAAGPRLEGAFLLKGKTVKATGMFRANKGQKVTRNWKFTPQCADPCGKVKVRRSSATSAVSTETLIQKGSAYSGKGKVQATCNNKRIKPGRKDSIAVSVKVTKSVIVGGVERATEIQATVVAEVYARRYNKACKFVRSTQRTTYTGKRTDVPQPPVASFDFSPQDGSVGGETNTIRFIEEATDDREITAYAWDFGDPGSGANNTHSFPGADHTYASPGTYTVTLTVTDDQGLTATTTRQVTVAP